MRRLTIWTFLVTIILGLVLFYSKHMVVQIEHKLSVINETLRQRKESLRVLEAEWGHLNNPSYLQKLCEKFLPHLQPVMPHQMLPMKSVPFRKPSVSIPDDIFDTVKRGEV